MKIFVSSFLITFIIVFLSLVEFSNAKANEVTYHSVCAQNEDGYYCERVEGIGKSECDKTSDCLDCDHDGDNNHKNRDDYDCLIITPTITPTPSATPSAQCVTNCSPASPNLPPSSTNPPGVPTCTIGIQAPILQGYKKTSKTSITWSWWPSLTSGIEKQWIEYGYSKENYPYNVFIPTDATWWDIGAQDPNASQHWARICVSKGGCNICSNDLDP